MGRSLPFGRANPRFWASSLILQPKGRGLRGAEPPATQRKRHNAWSRRLLVGGSALLSSQTPPFWLLHFPLSQKGGVCEAHEAVAESGVRCGLFGRDVARRGHAVVVVGARGRCKARDRRGWLARVGAQALRGTRVLRARSRCRARDAVVTDGCRTKPCSSPIFQKISMACKNFS